MSDGENRLVSQSRERDRKARSSEQPYVPMQSAEHDVLGNTIRELRARRALSQERLGFASGLHRNYVGAIERGEINPTFRVLMKLSEGLAFPLSQIFVLFERRVGEPPPPRRRRRQRS
jgi:DNA-binding XRE family transcriptional regulator